MRRCRKLISMIVMMAMLATMTPYQALAAEPPSDAAAQEIQTVAEEEGQEQEQDTQETIPEDKKESDEGQDDLEEGGEAAPSEDPSEVTSGSDAVDNSSTEAVAEDADPENSDAGKSAQSTQETAAPEETGTETMEMPKKLDLTGEKYGNLTVIGRCGGKFRYPTWECECACGNRIQAGSCAAEL